MPSLGTTARWPGFAAPLVALLVTLLLTWLLTLTLPGADVSATLSGLALLVLLPAPLFLAVLWGGALLVGRPYRLAPVAAMLWFVAGWILVPHDIVWQLVGHIVAGLLAGLALGLRWRLDKALLLVALALCPILIWTTIQVPVTEQLQIYSDEMLKSLEQNLPAGADDTQRSLAVAAEREKLGKVADMAAKVYPFVLGVGVLGQAGIILALLWLAVRAVGLRLHGWRLPPFSRWRVPFYLLWFLVAGLGLMITRRAPLANIGLNLALLAACIISIQGIAVQFFVTGRMMSTLGRVIYWTVMGIFFVPLVVASGVVLGLADQWWDIRRLDAEIPSAAAPDDENDDS